MNHAVARRRMRVPLLVLLTLLFLCGCDRAGGPRAAVDASPAANLPQTGATMRPRPSGEPVTGTSILKVAEPEAVREQFPFLSPAQLADGRWLVALDIAAISSLAPGNGFALQLAGLEERYALVESVQAYDGMRRIQGSLLDVKDRTAERFSMTVSSDGSYVAGHLMMAGRELSLQVRHGSGWVADASAPALSVDESLAR